MKPKQIKKLKKLLLEVFKEDKVPVWYLSLYIDSYYDIWRKNDKSKK